MNREIKFRVWNGWGMEYNIVVGQLGVFYTLKDPNDSACLNPTTIYNDATPVMQFTGFTDRNGKEIYEGDIFVSYTRKWEPVEFEDGQWQANLQGARVFSVFELFDGVPKGDHPVVIGNMFQNPELV
jgi:uncharacterized phage protein (TIGR01671 family)